MPISKKRLAEINELHDKDIDTSDIPELDADFWKHAKLVMPKTKKTISLRLDPDILSWFKSLGCGYQTRMNAVLRAYMNACQKES